MYYVIKMLPDGVKRVIFHAISERECYEYLETVSDEDFEICTVIERK